MPILSKENNCAICASPEHKAPNCHRREPDAVIAKPDTAKARAAAKRDAAKARAAAKRAEDRAIVTATKEYKARQDAVHNAVYEALSALAPMPQTAGSYKHSRWAVVADVCVRCERPPKGCMCVF
jgi:hypothetical protein